jgi:hypothetical protein
MKVKDYIEILKGFDPELEMCQYPRPDNYPKDFTPCNECGNIRPCPTSPGKWEFHEHVTLEKACDMPWTPCEIRFPQKGERDYREGGLRLWAYDADEPIWWPQHGAAWRKRE